MYDYIGNPIVGTYRHRRTAATHVLAVLISPDNRKRKPYALPVQLIPYVGLSLKKIRLIVNNVAKEMVDRGMTVMGKHMICFQERE